MTVISEIDGKPIRWTDEQGLVHAVTGSDVHPGVRLLWTLCDRDVPANAAHTGHDAVSCEACHARLPR